MCILLKFKLERWETQETRLIYWSFLRWVIQKLFSKGFWNAHESLSCSGGNREEHSGQPH